ncbi:MAG: carbamoyltransferase HypF [bacterium]
MRARKKIKIYGIIACKAFISHIFQLTKKFNLSGWIKNSNESTNMEVEGDNASIIEFVSAIYDDPKKTGHAVELNFYDMPVLNSENFHIIEEKCKHKSKSKLTESIPKDFATCDECLNKIFDIKSKKYYYSFTACEKCGPKYSIVNSLPFTRENSSIHNFEFCEECKNDINKGLLETNFSNCPVCGPKVWLKIRENIFFNQQESFVKAAKILSKNKTLLLKSTNCFYLCANAFSTKAVEKIREIKERKNKPLTVMAKNIQEIEKFAYLNDIEKELLTSKQRPVVLVKLKKFNYLAKNITSGFDNIGVMLPSNPIHHLLFASGKLKVLVMSSANKNGTAIETNNTKAEEAYGDLVFGILFHDLNILNGSDDSIVTVVNNEKYFFRLARGYTPNSIIIKNASPVILACGAYQNSTVALGTPDGKIHIGPYVGNLETANIFDLYKKNIALFCKLFDVTPEYAVCDLSPDYLSTKHVMSLKIPFFQIQHHYAHLISCLVDNNIPITEPVIGVIFDNSGFGDDQTVWGGEFLVSKDLEYKRITHIPIFKIIGIKGKESQIYRLGYSMLQKAGISLSNPIYKKLNIASEEEKMFSGLIDKGINSQLTSSAGKLFDAIASILGILKYSPYEEYSALYLESLADKSNKEIYNLREFHIKNTNELIQFIVKDVEKKEPIHKILARFHNSLAKMVACTCFEISKRAKIHKVALSGSVWMNILLLTRTIEELEKFNLKILIHKNISTNDESLSLGQAAYLMYKVSDKKAGHNFTKTVFH